MLRIAVVVGSTRSGRQAGRVARWVVEQGRAHVPPDVEIDLVDLAEIGLPLLDEPAPAITGEYAHEHTRRWSRVVDGYDGFVFVVGEHNHSFPAALKNALDHLFAEWRDKAAGFVGYGVHSGGAAGIEQLRLVLAELQVAGVRSAVRLGIGSDIAWDDESDEVPLQPRAHQAEVLAALFDELVAWAGALRGVREGARVPDSV